MKIVRTIMKSDWIGNNLSSMRKLYFLLVMFHSAVLEKRWFGKLSWSKDFQKSISIKDLQVSITAINSWADESILNLKMLEYIIGDIHYCGYMADQND